MQRSSGWFCDRPGRPFRRTSLSRPDEVGQASAASFGPDTREHGARVSGSDLARSCLRRVAGREGDV